MFWHKLTELQIFRINAKKRENHNSFDDRHGRFRVRFHVNLATATNFRHILNIAVYFQKQCLYICSVILQKNHRANLQQPFFGIVRQHTHNLFTLLAAVSSKAIRACALVWPNTATSVKTLFLANCFKKRIEINALQSRLHYKGTRF